ncbi:methyltransferase [Streptomyces sioyaensis]|uniref:methyltransferase n=1 Tax=Streptomyces sioyaensis TaxID=67364 RepID=UPI0033F4265F
MTTKTSDSPLPWPPAAEQLPPHLRLMGIAAAKWVVQPVYVLAKLGAADHLAEEELSTAALADRLKVRCDPLRRCLRAAASVGIFRETEQDHWALTDTADHLRTDAQMSLRDFTVLLGEAPMWAPFGHIMDVMRQDTPAFDAVHGQPMYAHLAEDDELARTYHGAWSSLTEGVMRALTTAYDFSRFATIADLGGGDGTALRILLATHPQLRGILMDLSHSGEIHQGADRAFEERLRTVSGRLPDDVPPGADAYFLKNTLHCLSPDLVLQTLRRIRSEMTRPEQRLLIVEGVVQQGNGFDWSKLMDIEVMVNNGGREHSLEEWRTLLSQSGFRLTSAREVLHPQWLLEAEAA